MTAAVPGTVPEPGATSTAPRERPGKGESFAARAARVAAGGVLRIFLLAVAVFWLVPTIGLLISSLRSPSDIADDGWWKVFTSPAQLTIENYGNLLDNSAITHSLWSTVLITVPSTLLVVVIGSLAGYAFAWMDFPGRDGWFLLVVGLLVVPVQVALLPVSELFGWIGIFESTIGVILFHVAFGLPFAVFLLRNFFAEIPRELLEAARLDGAGELRLFTRVVMPLAGPAIASLGIFQFLWVWNDMLIALIFADSGSPPITVALQQQVRQFGNNVDILAPGAFLSMLIPLVVFFAFQRQFVSGVMAGAVK
ncbi:MULTISPECIES: carbohydrate ABC transporter permease [unclassified Streptomyces]|uniref:carbohydrate ABC transporter permease n=1 Tax=Streptomyces TaxID=1883 RepID=UPI000319446F|nr:MULTISPECIES: carbohydrate ABC transporter permease [unclassified Streptomyces]ASY33153.1 sugar ABC transporter permease [Streptomyces sp. CLI2509]MDT0423811.1 carbohydrate ABC transporter permease [Streptomyces sp. DSM 41859]MYX21934.1 ABC transporter permease subunit [Streptomyces sp. SID8380]NJA58052.1 carbohydrate ABC transporter permease [Streptomyces sp. NEAU-H3]WEH29400.1 carbohydrate ABC transporter permease [Streptomyces sp. AM 3-1-1]